MKRYGDVEAAVSYLKIVSTHEFVEVAARGVDTAVHC